MKARKAILVGDHRQLPPMFNEHEEGLYKELMESQEAADERIERIKHPLHEKRNQIIEMLRRSSKQKELALSYIQKAAEDVQR